MLPFVLAAVGALVLIVGAVLFGVLPRSRSTAPIAMPSATATGNEPTTRGTGSSMPPVTAVAPPITEPEEAPDAASASTTASKSTPQLPKSPPVGMPMSDDKANAKSRVDQRGLVKDNPFK
jgi:hypothetical protein